MHGKSGIDGHDGGQGVDIATLPFHVIEQMLTHYKSMEGMQRFVDDVVPEYEALFD